MRTVRIRTYPTIAVDTFYETEGALAPYMVLDLLVCDQCPTLPTGNHLMDIPVVVLHLVLCEQILTEGALCPAYAYGLVGLILMSPVGLVAIYAVEEPVGAFGADMTVQIVLTPPEWAAAFSVEAWVDTRIHLHQEKVLFIGRRGMEASGAAACRTQQALSGLDPFAAWSVELEVLAGA